MAKQLIDSLAGDFEPEKYRDTYRQEVLELIERKAQGKEIAVQPPPEEPAEPAPDLMSALKASLEAVRERDAEGDGAATEAARSRAKRKPPPPKKAAAAKPAAKKAAATRVGPPSEKRRRARREADGAESAHAQTATSAKRYARRA